MKQKKSGQSLRLDIRKKLLDVAADKFTKDALEFAERLSSVVRGTEEAEKAIRLKTGQSFDFCRTDASGKTVKFTIMCRGKMNWFISTKVNSNCYPGTTISFTKDFLKMHKQECEIISILAMEINGAVNDIDNLIKSSK